MEIGIRPLPQASELIEATGLQMTYPFEDLVFVEHNPFLIQFNDEDPRFVYIHFNVDCFEADRKSMLESLEKKGIELGMQVIETSRFTMRQKEDVDEIELEFI